MRLTVLLSALLVPTIAHATSEPRETKTGLEEQWHASSVTVVLDPSLEDLAPGASVAIEQAMATWMAGVPGLPSVTFAIGTERASVGNDHVNVVLAAPITLAGHENDLATTTTYADDDTGEIIEADTVFNTKYVYAVMPSVPTGCEQIFDLGAVATHESGHFFGLGEDYSGRATTMFVTTNACDPHKRTLTTDDTSALTALYAPPTSLVASCSSSPTKTNTKDTTFALLVFASAVCAARKFRARISP